MVFPLLLWGVPLSHILIHFFLFLITACGELHLDWHLLCAGAHILKIGRKSLAMEVVPIGHGNIEAFMGARSEKVLAESMKERQGCLVSDLSQMLLKRMQVNLQ
jgi:hypothetical protein